MPHLLVGSVDIIDGQDGQVAVIPEIAKSHPGACFQTRVLDGLLGEIEGDWHGEQVSIG